LDVAVIDAIVAGREARLRELDPLLPRRQPLPELVRGEASIVVEGAVGSLRGL
jgi:hypothetical protein